MMKYFIKYITYFFLLILTACSKSQIDKKYAEELLKKELSIKGQLSTKELKGGYGGAYIYYSTDGINKYIVKIFKDKNSSAREIYNSKVASKDGIGPKVYFADSSKGILIMEYLSGKKITNQDLQSDKLYVFLAELLQKIHKGDRFNNFDYDPFKRIDLDIQKNKSKYFNIIPLIELEEIALKIQKTLTPYFTIAPCHNDLHFGNLMLLDEGFKVIDFADAGKNDPYFDLATVATTPLIYSNFLHEKIMFETYLGHQPTNEENAKLYLMKQIVLIKWALDHLNRVSSDYINRYKLIESHTLNSFVKPSLEGSFDEEDQEHNLQFLKSLINQIIENSKSNEFSNSIHLLSK